MSSKLPTDKQVCECLAFWLMCGPTFTTEQRREVCDALAGGYRAFSGFPLEVIDMKAGACWFVTDKGRRFLEEKGKQK